MRRRGGGAVGRTENHAGSDTGRSLQTARTIPGRDGRRYGRESGLRSPSNPRPRAPIRETTLSRIAAIRPAAAAALVFASRSSSSRTPRRTPATGARGASFRRASCCDPGPPRGPLPALKGGPSPFECEQRPALRRVRGGARILMAHGLDGPAGAVAWLHNPSATRWRPLPHRPPRNAECQRRPSRPRPAGAPLKHQPRTGTSSRPSIAPAPTASMPDAKFDGCARSIHASSAAPVGRVFRIQP